MTKARLSAEERKDSVSENASPSVPSLLRAVCNWAYSNEEQPGDSRQHDRDVAVTANTSDILSVPR